MPDHVEVTAALAPIGGGLPIHASTFQIVIDQGEVTLVFLQKSLAYSEGSPTPTASHRVVAQIALGHMVAKDFSKQIVSAIKNFEDTQFPIPDIESGPISARNAR